YPGRTAALDVASESGRDLDGGLDGPALQTLLEIGIIGERRLFYEISRTSQLLEVGPALVALVVIEHREGQIVDVGRNSKSEDQHQECCAEQGEGQPDGIAKKLDRFADRISEQALQAESALPRRQLHGANSPAGRCIIRGL